MRKELVVISDIHVHPWSAHASGTGRSNSRLQRTLQVLRDSLQDARDRDGIWVCGGDIVHTIGYATNEVLNAVSEVLGEFPDVTKIMVWGNHDTRGKGNSKVTADESVTTILSEAVGPSLTVLNEEVVEEQGIRFYGAGAQPKKKFLQIEPPESADVGIFHLTVSGVELPSGFELESDIEGHELVAPFNLTIAGDIHHPQTVTTVDGKLLLIPGSPEHHNFGDHGKRGWWVVGMEESVQGMFPVDWEHIDSGSPRFITVDSVEDVKDDDNYYRVLGETRDEDVPENAQVVSSPPSTVEERDVLDSGSSGDEVVAAWVDHEDPDGDRERYIEVGRKLIKDADLVQLKDAKLKRVRGENFFSYEEFDWHLNDGVNLVVGQAKDYDSNGSGKSSLVGLAPMWCIFGKSDKDISASEVIRWGADAAWVEVTLDVNGEEVIIKRRRTRHSIDVEATIDGEPIKGSSATEMTDKLTDYLGITPEIYKALAYYSQHDLLLFSNATDAERKDIMADLSGSSAYQEASTTAGQTARDKGTEREKILVKKESAEEDVQSARENLEEKRETSSQWEEQKSEKIQEADDQITSLRDADPTEDLQERLTDVRERIGSLRNVWDERAESRREDFITQFSKDMRERLTDEVDRILQKWEENYPHPINDDVWERAEERVPNDLDKLQEEQRQLEADIEKIQENKQEIRDELNSAETQQRLKAKELKEARNLSSGSECPKCGQEITEEHVSSMEDELSGELSEIMQRVDVAEAKMDAEDEKLADIEEEYKEVSEDIKDLQQWMDQIEERNEDLARLKELKQELAGGPSQSAVEAADSRVESLKQKHHQRLDAWERRVASFVRERIEEFERKLESAERQKSQWEDKENPHQSAIETLEERIEEKQAQVEQATEEASKLAEEIRIYEFWQEGFSKRGVQSLLLDELAQQFNRVRTEIFPIITGGVYDVQFSTQSRTQSGELREKTDFIVRYEGEEISYGALSGGQRRRVDLGVMLCFALANSRMRNTRGVLGVLIGDEVFDHLDEAGQESAYEALQIVNKEIPSIYVISHNSSLQSLFDNVLEIEQDEQGISRIVGS